MSDIKKIFGSWLNLEHEELNKKRLVWGVLFCLLGLCLLISSNFSWIREMIFSWIAAHWITLSWVIGWSSIGIGIGLINSRLREKKKNKEKKESRDDQHLHYTMYYLIFALPVVSLAAYVLAHDNGTLNKPLSTLIGITFGFAAEKINELDLVKQ